MDDRAYFILSVSAVLFVLLVFLMRDRLTQLAVAIHSRSVPVPVQRVGHTPLQKPQVKYKVVRIDGPLLSINIQSILEAESAKGWMFTGPLVFKEDSFLLFVRYGEL